MKKSNTSRKKSNSYRYNIGDLVACYENSNTYKILVGWVCECWNTKKINFYRVQWCDDDRRPNIINSPIREIDLEPCYNLLQEAIKLDIWVGKKIS